MYLALDDREDLPEKVLTEMKLTRKWVLAIVGDKWPLQHRHVLGRAVRIRSPYVDVLSLTQVLALKSLRKKVDKEELSHGKREGYTYLIVYGQINVYSVTTKSERYERSYWTRTAAGNGIGGRKAPVPYGS